MTVNERIDALRQEMKKENIDFYLIPMADYHTSEYVGDYFKGVQYISGFTGWTLFYSGQKRNERYLCKAL